jgi:hypothetical protein
VWFSQFLGLQIGTQFCPGMMIGNPRIIVGNRIEFFVARKLRRPAGSLKSTYRVVNTTFLELSLKFAGQAERLSCGEFQLS